MDATISRLGRDENAASELASSSMLLPGGQVGGDAALVMFGDLSRSQLQQSAPTLADVLGHEDLGYSIVGTKKVTVVTRGGKNVPLSADLAKGVIELHQQEWTRPMVTTILMPTQRVVSSLQIRAVRILPRATGRTIATNYTSVNKIS
jgi:hypothetical protein